MIPLTTYLQSSNRKPLKKALSPGHRPWPESYRTTLSRWMGKPCAVPLIGQTPSPPSTWSAPGRRQTSWCWGGCVLSNLVRDQGARILPILGHSCLGIRLDTVFIGGFSNTVLGDKPKQPICRIVYRRLDGRHFLVLQVLEIGAPDLAAFNWRILNRCTRILITEIGESRNTNIVKSVHTR